MTNLWNWRYHAEQANLTDDNLTRLLEAAFNDRELRFFCYDHAPWVYQKSQYDDQAALIKRLLRQKESLNLPALIKPYAPGPYHQYMEAEAGWNDAAADYQAALEYHVKSMTILGQSKPVPLEGEGAIFTDVYLLDEPTAYKRHALNLDHIPQRLDRLDDSERRKGFEVVTHSDSPNLFVLGKPGAGKTTFLKYIALQAIKGKLSKVPFFINLHEWANEGRPNLMSYLSHQLAEYDLTQAEPLLTHWLQTGQALLLFDGLDEIAQEDDQWQQAVKQLQRFAKDYYRSQIIISCRIAVNQYRFQNFQLVEVADFDDDQIRQFVGYWFAEDKATRQAFLNQFFNEQDDRFRELGNIPILLSLLCLGFRGSFPQNRVLLYEEAVQRLLTEWDESKGIDRVEDEIYRDLWPEDKEALFAQLAYETFNRSEYYIPAHELERWLQNYLEPLVDRRVGGREILRAIVAQHGILVERARNIYSFSHLTFQEYFTAKYIADNERRGTVERLMAHITDSRWQEIFLLTVSLLAEADEFFVLFQQAIDDLALNGRGAGGEGETPLIPLLEWVSQQANQMPSSQRLADLRLGYLGIYLARPLALARDLPWDLARDLPRDLGSDLARHLARAFDLALDLDRALDRALDLAIYLALAPDLDRALDLNLNQKFGIDLALDMALTYAWHGAIAIIFHRSIRPPIPAYMTYLDHIIQMSHRLPTSTVANRLLELTRPPSFPPQTETGWQTWLDELQQIMKQERNLFPDIELSEEDVKQLTRYLEASDLLRDCLEVAVVSDRAGIEGQLLRVPRPAGGGEYAI